MLIYDRVTRFDDQCIHAGVACINDQLPVPIVTYCHLLISIPTLKNALCACNKLLVMEVTSEFETTMPNFALKSRSD